MNLIMQGIEDTQVRTLRILQLFPIKRTLMVSVLYKVILVTIKLLTVKQELALPQKDATKHGQNLLFLIQ